MRLNVNNFHADVFEEFFSPVTAAQALLHSAVSKRKEVLQKTMGFIMQVLTTTPLDPRQKAGALHMVGAVADVLLQVGTPHVYFAYPLYIFIIFSINFQQYWCISMIECKQAL